MSEHSIGRINAEVLNALGTEFMYFDEVCARVWRVLPDVPSRNVRRSLVGMAGGSGIGTEYMLGKGWRKRVDPDPELDTESSASVQHFIDTGEYLPKPLTFTLTITLGNDGMRDFDDIAGALETSADTLRQSADCGVVPAPGLKSGSYIRDVNGSTVGSWAVK